MWFFNSFVKSLYDLNWLRDRREKLGKAFSYLFLFTFFVVGLNFVSMSVAFYKSDLRKDANTFLSEKLPDFTATIKNGELLITGLEQPFIKTDVEGQNRFVIVVDTVSTGTLRLEDYLQNTTKAMSGVLITKDKFEMYDLGKDQFQSQSFRDVKDLSFDRARVLSLVDKFLSKPMLFLYSLIMFLFLYVGAIARKLIGILLASVLILVVVKIAKRQWKFKEIFAVGAYATTLGTVVGAVIGSVGVPAGYWVFWLPFVVLLVWLGVAVLLDNPAPVAEIKS